jgi:alkanesulfonate monooxygenase SsuD/methylene tetrahydromethanopterin reductase-like flavin-dependent oxidoreductase (luciferase family)
VTGAYFAWTNVDRDDARARRDGIETLSKLYNQDMSAVAGRYLVLGSPERVVERLSEYAAAGAQAVVIAPACAGEAAESLSELVAEAVIPALRLGVGVR